MVSSTVLALLVGGAFARPAQNFQDAHPMASDLKAHPRTYPTGVPSVFTGNTPRINCTHNGTHGDTPAVSWLPETEKVRGVNLGSQFIIEPWMTYDEWNSMGCGHLNDEWQCVGELGQETADIVFEKHWDTWITREDIDRISSLGLNVVRIPVGFWMKEDLVLKQENYPRGGIGYLDRLVGWAADAGLYVILDLHGAPGSQYPNQEFTGHVSERFKWIASTDLFEQRVDVPGFYTPENYERALNFLEWIAKRIYSNKSYRTTGVLQVMNEPVHASDYPVEAADMIKNFYPSAYTRIRATERSLGVRSGSELKIQYMGKVWGAGDPTTYLPADATNLLFDDHRYYKWDPNIEQTKDDYISAACSDDRGGADTIVGEWSLSISDEYQNNFNFTIGAGAGIDPITQKKWYQSFWAAQVQAFEHSRGHIFWSYKCNWIGGMDEWRWCYQSAVANGVIPTDASSTVSLSPCS